MVADTHRLAQRIREGGAFTEEQADAIVEALSDFVERLATKQDLDVLRAELRGEMAESRAELRREMAELRAEQKADIAESRAELKADIANSRNSVAMWVASFGALILTAQLATVIAMLTQM